MEGGLGLAEAAGHLLHQRTEGVDRHGRLGEIRCLLGQVQCRQLVEPHRVVRHHVDRRCGEQPFPGRGHLLDHRLGPGPLLGAEVVEGHALGERGCDLVVE